MTASKTPVLHITTTPTARFTAVCIPFYCIQFANGNDCCTKWHQLLQMAPTFYEWEIGVGRSFFGVPGACSQSQKGQFLKCRMPSEARPRAVRPIVLCLTVHRTVSSCRYGDELTFLNAFLNPGIIHHTSVKSLNLGPLSNFEIGGGGH